MAALHNLIFPTLHRNPFSYHSRVTLRYLYRGTFCDVVSFTFLSQTFFFLFFVFPRTINWSYAPQNKKKIKSKSYIILGAHSHQAVCVKKLIRKGGPCRHLYKELGSLKALSVLPFYFFCSWNKEDNDRRDTRNEKKQRCFRLISCKLFPDK